MRMIDICSGLGGASEAMKIRGWDVTRVDINPSFMPDVIADVLHYSYDGIQPDLIWCSPPCTEFAREFMPWSKTGKIPEMSILVACIQIIKDVKPYYWVIENVKGAVKWFLPYLGRPAYVCNPYYLWGKFPSIAHVKVAGNKERLSSTKSAERGLIPFKLSNALAEAIEKQFPLPQLLEVE